MKKFTRAMALALAACMMLALAACGSGGISEDDVTTYVQGDLDATYKGIYDQDYIDLVEDLTLEDAQEHYNYNVAYEAEYLLYCLDSEYTSSGLSDADLQAAMEEIYADVVEKAKELTAEIYSHAQYTVGKADKLSTGDFAVEVTISPIEIVPLLSDEDYNDTWTAVTEANGITTSDQLQALSDEEYMAIDAQYSMAMLEKLEALIPELTYGTDQIIMLHLKLDDEGYYSLVDTGMETLDEVMIDYSGRYLA